MLDRMIEFVRSNSDCMSRSLAIGHITASAWITDHERTHVLLTHHRRLDRWLQLGGHVDQGEYILDAALREAREESGLTTFAAVSPGIFDVDIHPIPPKKYEAAHLHYDVRFLLEADRTHPLTISSESKDVVWALADQVTDLNADESITRMAAKFRQLAAVRPAGN